MPSSLRPWLLSLGALALALAVACGTSPAAPAAAPPKAAATTAPATSPAAPTAVPKAAVPRGGEIRVGVFTDVEGFDPGSPRFAGQWGMPNIYDALLSLNEKAELAPGLATSWTVDTPTQITMKLRTGVKFHDGTDFNAEAAKWSLDRILDPALRASSAAFLADVAQVTAVDPTTLRLTLKGPSAPQLSYLATRPAYITSPTAVRAAGEDYFKKPVGTGPYTFVEWTPNSHMTFARNPNHWNAENIHPDRVTFRIVPDASVKLINLQTGQLDMIDSINPKDVAAVKADSNLVYLARPDPGYWQISMNCTTAPFNQRGNRNALQWSLDREALIRTTEFGVAVPARTSISPILPTYDPDAVPVPKPDLDRARRELADAGNPNGFRFKLTVYNDPLNQSRAQVMQGQWRRVGIDAELVPRDVTTAIADLVAGQFEGMFLNSSYRGDTDGSTYSIWHSQGVQNRGKCSDPQLDPILERARQVYDIAERRRLYGQAEKYLIENNNLMIFPMHSPLEVVHSRRVVNYTFTPDFIYRFRMVGMGIQR